MTKASHAVEEPIRRSWIVTARVTVLREYVTEICTEEEARKSCDALSEEERDIGTIDVEVRSVEPNE